MLLPMLRRPRRAASPVLRTEPTRFDTSAESFFGRRSGGAGRLAAGDFAPQVGRAFATLGKALRSAGLDYADVAQLRTFIVDHDLEKLEVLGKAIARIWGDKPPVQTLAGVAALVLPKMRFEVDAVAVQR